MDELSLDHFDYHLPPESIAQQPAEVRDQARLLVDSGAPAQPRHLRVADLPELLGPSDVVVVNDAKVLRARLMLRKQTGGNVEVLALHPVSDAVADAPGVWEALVRPGRRVAPGTTLYSESGEAVLVIGAHLAEGRREMRPAGDQSVEDILNQLGSVPLPPYITSGYEDEDRYQTVYADQPSAVAAPTAGLHLTDRLIAAIRAQNTAVCHLNLAVGLGTFRPINTANVLEHDMHVERYEIPEETWQLCLAAKADGGRVVAIGTTVVRALESAAVDAGRAEPKLRGESQLFITPGFQFNMVDSLLTNFHLPRSTLLVLLAAFMGARWRDLYQCALDDGYRFLSFGDAMFCSRYDLPTAPSNPSAANRP